MTADKPTRRIGNDVKQILFVVGAAWGLFHMFALAVAVLTRDATPLAAALFIDASLTLFAGLVWLARRIFPTEGKGQ